MPAKQTDNRQRLFVAVTFIMKFIVQYYGHNIFSPVAHQPFTGVISR